MFRKNKFQILLTLFALLFATLACTMNIGGPDYPETAIPVSQEAVQGMQDQFKSAFETAATSGNVILTITEEQITSVLHYRFAEQVNPLITEPQVLLRNGTMDIYGKATQGYFVANVKISVKVGADAEGQPLIEIISSNFGPLPTPEGINTTLSVIIKEAYTGAVGPVATGFRIEQIGIRDGFMVMAGKVK